MLALTLSELERAIELGFDDAAAIRTDLYFGKLTSEPALTKILARLDANKASEGGPP
jgi:hypothetical protein